MKKFILSLITLSSVFCVINAQSTFEVDGICYKIVKEADEASTFGLVHVCPKPYGQYEDTINIPNAIKHGIDEFADKYKVVGIDPATFANTEYLESVILPPSIENIGEDAFYNSSLTSITIPYGNLKSIPDGVFYCSRLKSVHLPKSVIEIGERAFANNNLLETVIAEGVIHIRNRAFNSCTDLKTVKLPETLITIGNSAFDRCLDLVEINFPSSLKSIGILAFCECKNLTEFKPQKGIVEIKERAFNHSGLNTVTIPEGLTRIDMGVFSCCFNLKKVTIPNSIKRIGNYAFSACKSLHDIILPESIKVIGHGAFFQCQELEAIYLKSNEPPTIGMSSHNYYEDTTDPFAESFEQLKIFVPIASLDIYRHSEPWKNNVDKLTGYDYSEGEPKIGEYRVTRIKPQQYSNQQITSFSIPEGIEEIGEAAFYNCTNLTKVSIPNSVTTIKYSAFYKCTNLKDINLPKSINSIEHGAFADCQNLEKIIIPEGVTVIDSHLFRGCKNLTEVILPSTLKTICKSAFSDCSSLQSIIIPEGVTTIEDIAFMNCKSLKQVILPATLQKIGYEAFWGCESLLELNLPSSITFVERGAFSNCGSLSKVAINGKAKEWDQSIFLGCPNLKIIEINCDLSELNPDSFYGYENIIKRPASNKAQIIAVDLGLSVKWANINLDADFPEKKGATFAWGEACPKDTYKLETYKFYKDGKYTKYCIEDNQSKLLPEDDAATSILGKGWATPTEEEWKELIEKCVWQYESNSELNIYGYKITGPSGNQIFLPTGNMWSSTLANSFLGVTAYARAISLDSYKYNNISSFSRCMGFHIRPIKR